MTTKSLTQLTLEVRERSDNEISPTDNADPFVSDAELQNYLNNSIGDLWDTVTEANADQRYDTEFVFSTASNTDTYPLPADFYKLSGVDANIAGFTYTLYSFPWAERNRFANLTAPGWIRGSRLYYRLRQDNIVFSPIPDGLYTVTLHYVPEPVQLTTGADTIDFPNSWHEWLVLDSAIKVLTKEESDPQVLLMEKTRVENRIRNAAPRRDDANPQTVGDVSRQWELWLV